MVIFAKEEVCKIPHKHSLQNKPSAIFELQEVELIPFSTNQTNSMMEYQLKQIREGIKKFMECGFYISHGFDLTSNAQRRDRLIVPSQTDGSIDPLQSLDKRYMWNYNLYKQLKTQKIPNYWMIPMI